MSVLLSVLLTVRTWTQSRTALQLEILALRQQLQELQRTRPVRLPLSKMDRCLWALLSRIWTGWRTSLLIVKPEAVIPGTDGASETRQRQHSRATGKRRT